jgi:tRNA uridine 5-carboxymethylaminomethyl modification enzyme
LLREDNADLRLAKYGYELGLVNSLVYEQVEEKRRLIVQEVERMEKTVINPTAAIKNFFESRGWQAIRAPSSLSALLRRPEVKFADLAELEGRTCDLALTVIDEIETVVRYSGYIERQEEWVQRVQSLEDQDISDSFDFRSIKGFSREIQERLIQVRPRTVGQAARIPGITPAAIGLLAVHVGRRHR